MPRGGGRTAPPTAESGSVGNACKVGGRLAVIVRWLVNALALYITALLLPGIQLRGVVATLVAAAILGIVNAIIRPLLLMLTLPLNVVTLGLFTFVINALMLLLTSAIVPNFRIQGFGWALVGAVVLSIISFLLTHLIH
jgi:putative membrane protein